MEEKNIAKTREISALSNPTGNVYESVSIIAKRAKQVVSKTSRELNEKLETFSYAIDNLEEVFENEEQIALAKAYEKKPKPIIIATEEFLQDKLYYRYNDENMPNSLA